MPTTISPPGTRNQIRHRVLSGLLVAAVLIGFSVPSEAQEPRVSLAEVGGTPGDSLLMPVSLTPDAEQPMRSLTIDIEYVSNSLAFTSVSRGMGAELAGAVVDATLTETDPDDEGRKRATLRLTAALPEPASGQGVSPPGLPQGVLAYLLFQVAEEARPFVISLTPTVVSAQDLSTPPEEVSGLATVAGSVKIESLEDVYDRLAPEVSCFFFTH